MRTEKLIARLTEDCSPVRPVPPPLTRAVGWMMAVPGFVGAGLLIWGVRDDLILPSGNPSQQLLGLFALAMAASSAMAALMLAVPAARGIALALGVPVAVGAAWIVWLFVRIAAVGAAFDEALAWPYAVCLLKVASTAVVPALVLAAMLRGAPLRTTWIGTMIGLAAGSVGALCALLACPNDDPSHLLAGHLSAMLGVGLVGAVCGRYLTARSFPSPA